MGSTETDTPLDQVGQFVNLDEMELTPSTYLPCPDSPEVSEDRISRPIERSPGTLGDPLTLCESVRRQRIVKLSKERRARASIYLALINASVSYNACTSYSRIADDR